MPDWKRYIRTHLPPLAVGPAREAEIVAELGLQLDQAFAEALGLYARRRRFTLNLTLYNRLPVHRDVHAIVGDFTTLTLLEVDVEGEKGFAARCREVQERVWDDLDHRYVSGVEVVHTAEGCIPCLPLMSPKAAKSRMA